MLTPDQKFFFDHAGFSWDPKTETKEQGRERCAIALADAELVYLQAHRVADVGCSWEPDEDSAVMWREDGEKFDTCEQAVLWFGPGFNDDEVLASLGGITDADADYRRVIRAELALECLDRLQEIAA